MSNVLVSQYKFSLLKDTNETTLSTAFLTKIIKLYLIKLNNNHHIYLSIQIMVFKSLYDQA